MFLLATHLNQIKIVLLSIDWKVVPISLLLLMDMEYKDILSHNLPLTDSLNTLKILNQSTKHMNFCFLICMSKFNNSYFLSKTLMPTPVDQPSLLSCLKKQVYWHVRMLEIQELFLLDKVNSEIFSWQKKLGNHSSFRRS